MAAAEIAPGKWELEKSENFDDYMKAIGVGYATRLIGNKAKPKQEISIADGIWTIKTSTAVSNVQIQFKPGQEFEEKTADGRTVTTVCTIEGSKLVQKQQGAIPSTIIRDFSRDSFVMTLEAKDVKCYRYYKRAGQ